MKIESHNHPSAVEPYAGSATGSVGYFGTFSPWGKAGCRSELLRFRRLTDPHQRKLLAGAVAGMADYGSTFGLPMIGEKSISMTVTAKTAWLTPWLSAS